MPSSRALSSREAIACLQQAAARDLTEVTDKSLKEFTARLVGWIEKQQLESSAVDKQTCVLALEALYKDAAGEKHSTLLEVLDAFQLANPKKGAAKAGGVRSFELCFGDANQKSAMFRDRYALVYDRLARHELFTTKASEQNEDKFRLRKLEYLTQFRSIDDETQMAKVSKALRNVVFAGMLSQLRDGEWFLEDDTGVISLDLSQVEWQASLVSEACIVLVEGTIRDDRLIASAIGLPPVAVAASKQFSQDTESGRLLASLEEENADCMFLFLSDVHLDDNRTLAKLRTLFSGYEQADPVPYCFVLAGDFLSSYRQHGAAFDARQADSQVLDASGSTQVFLTDFVHSLERAFSRFAQLVKRVAPKIAANSHFVFLPGPFDPTKDGGGSPFARGHVTPRAGLLERFGEALKPHLVNVHLVSNPCVLRYATQRIFVVRDCLLEKMMQACICKPRLKSVFSVSTELDGDDAVEVEQTNANVEKKIGEQYLRTVLSQQYAAPLPLHYHTVRWPLGKSFALDPTPDLLVCATSRKLREFSCRNDTAGVQLLNPGSFSQQGYVFKAYYPANKQIEDCRLPD